MCVCQMVQTNLSIYHRIESNRIRKVLELLVKSLKVNECSMQNCTFDVDDDEFELLLNIGEDE